MRTTSLEMSLQVGRDCTVRFEKAHDDENRGGRDVFAERQKSHDALRCQLKKRKEAPSQARVKLTVRHGELKELRHHRTHRSRGS